MKTKVYLRIGRDPTTGKVKIDGGSKQNLEPFREKSYRGSKAIPIVNMAVNIEIPDEAFRPPNICASIVVPIEKVGTAIEVVDPLRIMAQD